MSDFEFLSVFISIIIGFGLTRLLGGLGRAFHFRRTNKMDVVHVAWTIAVLFVLILNWWVILLWRNIELWTFALFFWMIVWTSSMYVLALALYPPDIRKDVDYRQLFDTNRTWFLSTWTLMCIFDLIVTAMREGGWPDSTYIMFVGHYALITAVGVFVRNRKYDLIAAWYIAGTMAAWSFGVRATLF